MNFSEYIEKLRRKPARERERIAVIATGLAFLVILGIWVVSFSESNKQSTATAPSPEISNQMDDLKNDFEQGKQSIQDMLQSLPQDTSAMDNSAGVDQGAQANGTQDTDNNVANDLQNQGTSPQNQDNSTSQAFPSSNSQNSNPEIPQLP